VIGIVDGRMVEMGADNCMYELYYIYDVHRKNLS